MFMGARVEKGSHAPKLIVNNSLGLILNAKIHSGPAARTIRLTPLEHWKIMNKTPYYPNPSVKKIQSIKIGFKKVKKSQIS